MDRTKEKDAEVANRQANAPEAKRRTRNAADLDTAATPAGGAAVARALAGAALAAADRPSEESETAESIKRAAENDRRV